ncbi:MAG: polyisoprenoid-binding protein [Acetobacteraceae bacterium]|nr:MAG: polyisoprenoid-binding protein [Acetobacteraceae bacterium]
MEAPMIRALILSILLAAPVMAQEEMDLGSPPAGTYRPDPAHLRLWFIVDHLGFSKYMALFTKVDAVLQFDPENPEAMSVTATVDLRSLETHNPATDYNFNEIVSGEDLLNAPAHPEATFVSIAVKLTGEHTADVTGDMTLNGVTKPVVWKASYNGGWGHMPMDPMGARAGFSLETTIKRSDFGIDFGIPEPGTTMGVGDAVQIFVEVEMVNYETPKPQP